MSLPITFHRAASAEFIEASVWYESKRLKRDGVCNPVPNVSATPELLLTQNVSDGAACPVRL